VVIDLLVLLAGCALAWWSDEVKAWLGQVF
jgi:hypothetical protein